MSARFPALSARLLLTQLILKSVRKHSPPSATQPPHRFTTALLLLVTTQSHNIQDRSVKHKPCMAPQIIQNATPRLRDNVTRDHFRPHTRSPTRCVSLYPGMSVFPMRSGRLMLFVVGIPMLWWSSLPMIWFMDTRQLALS